MVAQIEFKDVLTFLPIKLWTVVFLILLGTTSLALADGSNIPAEDPSREWMGKEYADVIFSEFSRLYPDIKLVIDENDIPMRNSDEKWGLMEAARTFRKNPDFREGFVEAMKRAIPPIFSALAGTLEFGARINLSESPEMEKLLRQWIDTKPVGSIAPHELMCEALRLTNGHVISAWAVAWNLTRTGWERAAVRNYGLMHSKFISLTGERHLWNGSAHYIILPESDWAEVDVKIRSKNQETDGKAQKRLKLVVSKRGDEFSYLYHRIGVELFSMVTAKLTNSATLGWAMGTAGALGEFFKYPTTAGLNKEHRKRVNNDKLAAYSGSRLFKLVTGRVHLPPSGVKLGADYYLRSNKRKFGSSYAVPESRPAQYFGINVDSKFFSNTMSEEELEMRFYHATHVDSRIFDPIMLATTGEAERLHRGLVKYMQDGSPNAKLNTYIRKWYDGVLAYQPVSSLTPALAKIEDVKKDLFLDEWYNLPIAREALSDIEFREYKTRLRHVVIRVVSIADKTVEFSHRTSPNKPVSSFSGVANSCKDIFVNN